MRRPKIEPAGDYPEFGVRQETFNHYFDRPLPPSTFHDFVKKKGLIVPMAKVRGFYLLNESLRRLGLRQVKELPTDDASPTLEDLTRLAFTLIDPDLFPAPPWLLTAEAVDLKDFDHARRIASGYRARVSSYGDPVLKLQYFAGVLDCLHLEKRHRDSNA